MKKVISAMTAAIMTASAFASVISASAVYSSPDDVGFYLKAIPGDGYTVSDDGKTVTFASAADAVGKTVDVQHFIVADTSDPSVRAFSYIVSTSDDDKVKTPDSGVSLTSPVYDSDREYTIDGTTFKTNMFVNAFGFVNKLKKFDSNTGTSVESNSSKVLWEKEEPNAYIFSWVYAGKDGKENGTETAHFISSKSDDYPTSQFALTMTDEIVDGTYTVQFEQGYMDKNQGSFTQYTFINGGSTNASMIIPASLEGITIVVGDGNVTPPEPSETDAPEPSETDAPEPSETDTPEPSGTGPVEEEGDPTDYAWKIGKYTYDPENPPEDGYFMLPVAVWNDVGISGYLMDITVNGKALPDGTQADFPFTLIMFDKGDAYSLFSSFLDGLPTGASTIADTMVGEENVTAAQGAVVYNMVFEPKEGAEFKPGTVYTVGFDNASFVDGPTKENKNARVIDGAIIIAGGEVTPPEPSETDEPEPSETDKPEPSETDKPEPSETDAPDPSGNEEPGNYLYGDVNKNGEVELVDVVMLNRFLTKYDNQELDAYQTVVANCSRSGETDAETTQKHLNGQDSIEILKYLIGLVAALPNNA